jgi:hypothetical protein
MPRRHILYLTKHHTMKICRRVEVLLHVISTQALDAGEWSASCPGQVTPPGSNPQYTQDRRLGRPQRWSEHDGKEKNFLSLPGIEPAYSQVGYGLDEQGAVWVYGCKT